MRVSRKRYLPVLVTAVVLATVGATSPVSAAPLDAPARPAVPAVSQGTPERGVDREQRYDLAVTAGQGSSTPVVLPGLPRTTSARLTHPDPRAPGVALTAGPEAGLTVSVPTALAVGVYRFRATGTGCSPEACGVPFTVALVLTVVPIRPASPGIDSFTVASDDRLAAAEPLASGGVALRDELMIVLGSPRAPGTLEQARVLAASVGAVVAGGLEEIGVFQLRWTQSPDLDAIEASLSAQPSVAAVTRSTYGSVGEDAVPSGDWDDDGVAQTWPFTQIHAQDAWDLSTGGDVGVGIVDRGTVYTQHEDLNVSRVLGTANPRDHATHVAGLACAAQNGLGLVGSAWGCPITSVGVPYFFDYYVLESAMRMSHTDVGVVNMSLGWEAPDKTDMCVQSMAEAQRVIEDHAKQDEAFRMLFDGAAGREKVWVLSAGNSCSPTVLSPWTRAYDLPNVVTVAATNSDRALSSFSNFGIGVEVAAPGGVRPEDPSGGLWSTSVGTCWYGWDHCQTYEQMFGTSMAAPLVAGVAALVRSASPAVSAADVGRCLVSSAGRYTGAATERSLLPTKGNLPITPVLPYGMTYLRIVDAEAAVACGLDAGMPPSQPSEPAPPSGGSATPPPAGGSPAPPAPGAGPTQPPPDPGPAPSPSPN